MLLLLARTDRYIRGFCPVFREVVRVPLWVLGTRAGLRALLLSLLSVIAASTHSLSFILASHLRRICSAVTAGPSSWPSMSRSQRIRQIRNADSETSILKNRAAPGCILPLSSLNSASPHPRIVPSYIVGHVAHFLIHTFLHKSHTSDLPSAVHSMRICSIDSIGRPTRTGLYLVQYAPTVKVPCITFHIKSFIFESYPAPILTARFERSCAYGLLGEFLLHSLSALCCVR